MTRRGHTRGDGIQTNCIVGVPRVVRALCATDLDAHIVFIRRSLGAGAAFTEIAAKLGVSQGRVRYFAKKRRLSRNRPNKCTLPPDHGVSFLSYRPKVVRV